MPATREHTSVGVPIEHAAGERRVALVPDAVRRLTATGVRVVVEPGAGAGAMIDDDAFVTAGAVLGAPWPCDVVVKVAPPSAEEIALMRPGAALVGLLDPRGAPEHVDALRAAGLMGFALESIPRISRAQAMDALSSQSTVAGYEAVLVAAGLCTRFFPMLTTAAGTIPPARVLVVGVGVAGLQALATARRLGALTTGYDVRPEVAEQVRSVGASWLDLGVQHAEVGVYAQELSIEERDRQRLALVEAIARFDVVITTALVPGRPAPTLVSADAVARMKPGSVIVDLAGASGGNCELSVSGETVVRHAVTIAAPLNLPSALPEHASQLYARNVAALLEIMFDDEGRFQPDFDDEILAAACVTNPVRDDPEPPAHASEKAVL
jgi:NAD(P) transhydrogenase subunit alpha